VVVRRDPSGMVTLPPRPCLVIPAVLRHRCGLRAGDLVLLATSLGADMLAACCTFTPNRPHRQDRHRRQMAGAGLVRLRYATHAQLDLEAQMVARARADRAPRPTGIQAARALGAEPATLQTALAERASDTGNTASQVRRLSRLE
jgi:hypothetical protein